MPYEQFEDLPLNSTSLARIDLANDIIHEYRGKGFTLTLRQLYYQFVARGLLDNTERNYKNLGSLISKGRIAGLIDWYAIEDRTRALAGNPHWESTSQIVQGCAEQYRIDLWEGQQRRPEVWIEKEALVGVIARICSQLDVNYFACRGYVSQSEQYRAGKRIASYQEDGQKVVVLHFGDHDPSGIDMTRDNEDRLDMFARMGVDVQRLALNMDQIEQYEPPPNPAKLSDSRAKGYIREYGSSSWELDALEPEVITALIRDAVTGLVDEALMQEKREEQAAGREQLQEIADQIAEENDDE